MPAGSSPPWLTQASDALRARSLNPQLWFAQVDASNTTIWAQFKRVNPNERLVEINVRRTVFYPDRPGRNYLTVRGFAMRHAATPWAPPTAEQIGLIGTHWSKGWIIENNTRKTRRRVGQHLGRHRRGLRQDHQARPRPRHPLDQEQRRPSRRP
jgi:alpha-N-arabinofuranosidase